MSAILDEMRSWPWAWAWLGFFFIAILRAGGTYLLGRAVTAGLLRWRSPAERTRAMMDRVGRWGAPAVTLSFLTVGVQTAVNAAAGLIAMPWPRYVLGLVPGAAIWATIWTTIGMAAFVAALGGARAAPAVLVAALFVVALVTVATWSVRRRSRSS